MNKQMDFLSKLQFYPCKSLYVGCAPQDNFHFDDCPVESPWEKRGYSTILSGDCGEVQI